MKIAVVGLWHLGLVTAACLAQVEHDVLAYDPDKKIIEGLQKGITPIYEPGLDALLTAVSNKLQYTDHPQDIQHADIVWITFDTPVDDTDAADIAYVMRQIETIAAFIKNNALLLISSQLPVGTTRKIQDYFLQHHAEKSLRFGYIPENLRLGKAIQVFSKADRYVVGLQDNNDKALIQDMLGSFTEKFAWMSIESAEMTKHAVNAFLALSVTFINEIATLCENVGANASEVEAGLKSEERIGPKAYLRAGGAIGGGTLLRDINYLNEIGKNHKHPLPLLSSIMDSNTHHKSWVQRKITTILNQLKDKTVAILGLTYKPDTNTLRRSSSIETCEWLYQQGVNVNAFDPAIQSLDASYSSFINLKENIQDTLCSADAVIIATEWHDFRQLLADNLIHWVKQPIVLDPNGFLMSTLGQDPRIRYCSVGRSG